MVFREKASTARFWNSVAGALSGRPTTQQNTIDAFVRDRALIHG